MKIKEKLNKLVYFAEDWFSRTAFKMKNLPKMIFMMLLSKITEQELKE